MIAFFRDRILFLVRAIRLTLWFVTMLAVAGIHWCYAIDARRVANSFVWVIEQYQSTHGAYPIDLKAAGLDEKTARQTRLGYVVGSDGPSLFYSSTFNGFDTYFYDFRSRNWKFQPD